MSMKVHFPPPETGIRETLNFPALDAADDGCGHPLEMGHWWDLPASILCTGGVISASANCS